ncbi:hypothetical protein PISL3812_04471 [Talaromyces islandicus]|uniref:Uncharacterized protein n=1 Tax=Talaromyces islandicus TaxID=28573 RepID=A0A0U1LVM2_TALIS|nr:hypothetical protein PISL3812_04471 [Talaromyces islandicus]
MIATAARRQLSDESHLIHLSASSSRLLWLAICISYLLFLRFIGALTGAFVQLPLWLSAHIARIESRIVNLAASVLRMVAGETHATTKFGQQHRGRPGRDDGYSGRSLPNGPADDLIAPRHSSLEFDGMSEASYRQLNTRWLTHRPQAPRPPYRRGFENVRPSTTVTPPQPAVVNREAARSLGHDGTASSPGIIAPIPSLPIPSIPTFITRMPYISVSDSIYSSSSAGLLGRRRHFSASSSVGGRQHVKSETYTNLLPQRPSLDCNSPCRSAEKVEEHKMAQDSSSKNDAAFPGRFPSSEELDYGSLAAVTQQFMQDIGRTRKG